MYKFLKYVHKDWKGHEVMSQFNSFNSFVRSDFFAGDGPDGLFKPQWFWLRDESVDGQMVSYVGRLERLEEDMGFIESKISPSREAKCYPRVGYQNVSKGQADIVDWDDSDILNVLSNRYRIDFEKLGYEGYLAPKLSQATERIIISAEMLSLAKSFASASFADHVIRCTKFDGREHSKSVIFYGPYLRLPSGSYEVAIQGSLAGEFRVRLTAEQGRVVLEERKIWSTTDRISFSSCRPIVDFEVLMITSPRSEQLSIEKIVLTRT